MLKKEGASKLMRHKDKSEDEKQQKRKMGQMFSFSLSFLVLFSVSSTFNSFFIFAKKQTIEFKPDQIKITVFNKSKSVFWHLNKVN